MEVNGVKLEESSFFQRWRFFCAKKEVWDIDKSIELKVNCRGCASENNPEMLIPYALFATFEMAPDCGVDVYQKVVDKVQVKNAIKTV